jgi:hypothetical protein
MVGEIRDAISRLDPELPLYGAGSLEQMLGFAFFPSRAAAIALSAFGLLAIILAVTGIHGLIAYAVSTRTHEIGIRMALGHARFKYFASFWARPRHCLFSGRLSVWSSH